MLTVQCFVFPMTDLLLDTIRGADHQVSCEALIYCVGAVKFLTGNATILKRLARLDCIKVLATLMHNIIKTVIIPFFSYFLCSLSSDEIFQINWTRADVFGCNRLTWPYTDV